MQAGRRELKEYLGKGNEKAGEEEGWRKRGEGVMQRRGGRGSRKKRWEGAGGRGGGRNKEEEEGKK